MDTHVYCKMQAEVPLWITSADLNTASRNGIPPAYGWVPTPTPVPRCPTFVRSGCQGQRARTPCYRIRAA